MNVKNKNKNNQNFSSKRQFNFSFIQQHNRDNNYISKIYIDLSKNFI